MKDKDIVIETIHQMPEGVTVQQISEEIAVLAGNCNDGEAVGAERLLSHEEVCENLTAWYFR